MLSELFYGASKWEEVKKTRAPHLSFAAVRQPSHGLQGVHVKNRRTALPAPVKPKPQVTYLLKSFSKCSPPARGKYFSTGAACEAVSESAKGPCFARPRLVCSAAIAGGTSQQGLAARHVRPWTPQTGTSGHSRLQASDEDAQSYLQYWKPALGHK